MNEYIAMWKNYANFNDRTTVRGYWMAVLFNAIAGVIVSILVNITGVTLLSNLYSLAILVPGIAIGVRRMNDIGKDWKYVLINLIPIVGWIIFIVFSIKPSVDENGVPTV